MSGVWKHYEKDRSESIYKICGNKTQFIGSTTGMWYHLGLKHGIKSSRTRKKQENLQPKQPPNLNIFSEGVNW